MELSAGLGERIANALETLNPKQKEMARFVLDNRYLVSFVSASELGGKNSTSAASVVRFAQALGYEGYTEMQNALRSELPTHMAATTRMQKLMSAAGPSASIPQRVFYTDIKNIEQTANSLSDEDLNAALDTILKARRILVIGAGLSSAPAAFLSHSLKVMGFDALGIQGEGLQSAVELARIRSDDLMIAIDLWRYVRMTVYAVAQAKEKGARVIAITDSIVSPLTQMADIAFEIATEGTAHSLSTTALMSLLNVLVAMLADRAPEQVYEALQRLDAMYVGNDLLIMK